MKVSWLGTQVSSAFCLHPPPPPTSSYKKLFLEVKAKRGLPRLPAQCRAWQEVPNVRLASLYQARKLSALPRPSLGRAGWHGPFSVLGPGILRHCRPVQGDRARYV